MFRNFLKQKATYWKPAGIDFTGKRVFDNPVTMNVFWIEKNELIRDNRGDEIVSRITVYTDNDLEIGGYLALGNHPETDPLTVDGAYEIKQFNRIPNINGEFTVRKAFL